MEKQEEITWNDVLERQLNLQRKLLDLLADCELSPKDRKQLERDNETHREMWAKLKSLKKQ